MPALKQKLVTREHILLPWHFHRQSTGHTSTQSMYLHLIQLSLTMYVRASS